MIVVSIDPGVRACGVAVWRWSQGQRPLLLAAAHVKSRSMGVDATAWLAMAEAVNAWLQGVGEENDHTDDYQLVIEFPQTYGGKSAKGDTNDLLTLSAVVAAICAELRHYQNAGITVWRPREWKGNLPKEVTMARVEARLLDEEKRRIFWPAPSLKHNVYDAIAIGQKFFSMHPVLR